MKDRTVTVVATGSANLASVRAAFERAQVEVHVTRDPAQVDAASRLVLPGVGTFASAMHGFGAERLAASLRRRIDAGVPLLAICLGLQLLATASDESPGIAGLGVFAGRVRRLPAGERVPALGWNQVTPQAGCRTVTAGAAYFAHSFALFDPPPGWHAAWSEHGAPFVAALERDQQVACQFHPELSGAWGRALLERWLEAC